MTLLASIQPLLCARMVFFCLFKCYHHFLHKTRLLHTYKTENTLSCTIYDFYRKPSDIAITAPLGIKVFRFCHFINKLNQAHYGKKFFIWFSFSQALFSMIFISMVYENMFSFLWSQVAYLYTYKLIFPTYLQKHK